MVGLIHSVKMSGSMYLPWMLEEGAKDMWLITAGYVVLGTFFLVVGLVHRRLVREHGHVACAHVDTQDVVVRVVGDEHAFLAVEADAVADTTVR